MRLSRIYIENFRNFAKLDVVVSEPTIIVGENKIGKSNLLYALRLILDPSLPDSARQLREEDFWDGLPRPLTKSHRIVVFVEFTDFENSEDVLEVLSDHLVQSEPMTARLTYVYQPLATVTGNPEKPADYESLVYGGDRPDNHVSYEMRRRIPLDVLPALRDAEGDLAQWKRSPLRPLLDEAASSINRSELEAISEQVADATKAVAEIPDINDLGTKINTTLVKMVGSSHMVETVWGFSPNEPEKLLRALRLFIDGGRRGIGEASLGSANLLYLALKALELDQLVTQGERAHTFLAIEEPEAHLHPHLQRLTYRDFLKSREHHGRLNRSSADEDDGKTILVTTHSPHVVSVAPLKSLVLLRRTRDGKSTEGVSAAAVGLAEKDVADIERYLDATRSELLFSKGVILVEGDAELFLVPVLAKLIGVDFDELGITVCSVSGTNFTPYVKLLGPEGLRIPFAVITDFDPDGTSPGLGVKRVLKLLGSLATEEEVDGLSEKEQLKLGRAKGLFLGKHTFEFDLFCSGRHSSMCRTLIELTNSFAMKRRARRWMESPENCVANELIGGIEAVGKGRFAQRLATRIRGSACPRYVQRAIRYVAKRCR